MKVADVLAKANDMRGKKTVYWPGCGGHDPTAPLASQKVVPAQLWREMNDPVRQLEFQQLAAQHGIDLQDPTATREACDCSGYVCWSLGLAREQSAKPDAHELVDSAWLNTDTMWADAMGRQQRFTRLPRDGARVGALLLHPRRSPDPYGHVGIVSAVGPGGRAVKVLHCSGVNFKTSGDAVEETDTTPFEEPRLDTIVAWYRGLED